ncbi:2543_t:CDS:2 [Dentiscutata heterogama]|uniref:2543_t:CDS:1 n=1 Tax=Dentiscutata heterogama TaxID=1316150 RepID=A0ACA9NLZ6_9GLOM|nr:2543_t:CDS:2 [Dentiscutata heterogama]
MKHVKKVVQDDLDEGIIGKNDIRFVAGNTRITRPAFKRDIWEELIPRRPELIPRRPELIPRCPELIPRCLELILLRRPLTTLEMDISFYKKCKDECYFQWETEPDNNHAEIYAVVRALETCKNQEKNKDLFERIDILTSNRIGKVYFTYIPGHKGAVENKNADRLAKKGATISMHEKKKLSPYNRFMKFNLPIIKRNNPELDHNAAVKLVASMWKDSINNPKNDFTKYL